MSRRPYIRKVSRKDWWLGHARYKKYMARELSCIFLGAYMLAFVIGLWRLSQGQAAYEAYLDALLGPAGIVFQILVILFALYHTQSWFSLTPKAMPLRKPSGKLLPGALIIGGYWVVWVVVTVIILLLAGS